MWSTRLIQRIYIYMKECMTEKTRGSGWDRRKKKDVKYLEHDE